LTLSHCLDDEREVDEGDQYEVEFVESTENAAKAIEASEQSLDPMALT